MKSVVVLVVPLALVLLWGLSSALALIDPLFLPPPWAVAASLYTGLTGGPLLSDLFATVLRSLLGFAVAAGLGIPTGLLIGRIPILARATQPTIDFFRSIPATALFPLFLFLLGVGDGSKVGVVVYACALIILVNTAYGARQVKDSRLRSARMLGASRAQLFTAIVLPESYPGIFAGLRVALSLAFVLIIVTEMFIGTTVGLGYYIINAQTVYRIPDMYAGIVLAGIVGYLVNVALLRFERRALHWVGR